METVSPVVANLIDAQVYLSYPTRCPNCDGFVRLVGEHKLNGNWYCPLCSAYWAYSELEESIPWEKRFWSVQNQSELILDKSPMSSFQPKLPVITGVLFPETFGSSTPFEGKTPTPLGGILFGDTPAPNFPMNIVTGFLVPSYGYRIRRERKYLLAIAEDGTRTGRVKGGMKWGFELVFKNRPKTEMDTLIGFWETQGFWTAFDYTDPFKETEHLCYFDSKVEIEVISFDTADFSVTIVE